MDKLDTLNPSQSETLQPSAEQAQTTSELKEIAQESKELSEARQSVIAAAKAQDQGGDGTETLQKTREYFANLEPGEDPRVHMKMLQSEAGGSFQIKLPPETVPVIGVANGEVIFVGQDGKLDTYTIPVLDESMTEQERQIALQDQRILLGFTKQADRQVNEGEDRYGESVRQTIFESSHGAVATFEAFTKDVVDPTQMAENKKYTKEQDNWIESKAEKHSQYLDEAHEGAVAISNAIEAKKKEEAGEKEVRPSVLCMRGACGAGKTTAAKDILGDIELRGAIAPDQMKVPILRDSPDDTTAVQVHLESTALGKWHAERTFASTDVKHIIVDKLLDEPGDTIEFLDRAEETGRDIAYIDADVPLELSCLRVLTRTGGGEDPSIPFEAVASSFSKIRQNRLGLQEMLIEAGEAHQQGERATDVTEYRLVAWNPDQGTSMKVGEIVKTETGEVQIQPIQVEDPAEQAKINELFYGVTNQTAEQTAQEVQQTGDTIITEEFINAYVDSLSYMRGDENSGKRDALRAQYTSMIGKTIRQAMDEKAASKQ